LIDTQPAPTFSDPGSPAILTVEATAESGTLSYAWTRISDGGAYSGTTSPTLQISGATHADNGVYAVRVTNPRGTVFSRAARLTAILSTPAGEALDINTAAITNPDGWLAQGDHTSDGLDALRSAQITDNQSTETKW
jgi:hypothetical protein